MFTFSRQAPLSLEGNGGGLALGLTSACWEPPCCPVKLLWGHDHPILYVGCWDVCPVPGLSSARGQKVEGDSWQGRLLEPRVPHHALALHPPQNCPPPSLCSSCSNQVQSGPRGISSLLCGGPFLWLSAAPPHPSPSLCPCWWACVWKGLEKAQLGLGRASFPDV